LNPIAVENRFQLDVPGRPGWRFTGKMDMVDEGAVYDHKTAIFPWRAGRAEEEIQATGMLWAWNSSWLLECQFAPGLLLNKKVEDWEQTDSGIWVPVEGGGRFTNTFIYNIVTKGVFGKSVLGRRNSLTSLRINCGLALTLSRAASSHCTRERSASIAPIAHRLLKL
jgi:hypothetical protein